MANKRPTQAQRIINYIDEHKRFKVYRIIKRGEL